jgi:ligand-binding SRPBCC domain-containing protein
MRIFTFEATLWLPKTPEEIYPFFADASNLEVITPSFLSFHILTPTPVEMKPGTLIDYKLKIHGVPIRWRTRISVWEPPFRFVDEQLRGPYRQWIHEHRFEAKDGGTLCTDSVKYAVLGGALVNHFFVKKDVASIFEYRNRKLKEIFGSK